MVFSIDYRSSFNLLIDTVNNLSSVIQTVNGIFGIDSFRVNSSVSLLDPNNPAPLGYYEFQGEQISVSWYLVNTRLVSSIGVYDTISAIYPNLYSVTLSVFGRSRETYSECIRVVYESSSDGSTFEVLYHYVGFQATSNTYEYITVPASFDVCSFISSDGSFSGFCRGLEFKETEESVNNFVQNTLIN